MGLQALGSFLDMPLFTTKVFWGGITNFYLQTQLIKPCMEVYDKFCIEEVLRPNTNLLINGES